MKDRLANYPLNPTDIANLHGRGLVVEGEYFDVKSVIIFGNGGPAEGEEVIVSPIKVMWDRRVSTAFVPVE